MGILPNMKGFYCDLQDPGFRVNIDLFPTEVADVNTFTSKSLTKHVTHQSLLCYTLHSSASSCFYFKCLFHLVQELYCAQTGVGSFKPC